MVKGQVGMNLAGLRFALVLVACLLAIAGITLWPGVFRTTGHELDLIHTLDISYRVLEGDRPHLDFMTPLGVLSFLPISWLLDLGYGPGMAFLASQLVVALLLLPAIWWTGMSRFAGWLRMAYGISMLLLVTSLVFGEAVPALMASMHYNRWAWALASFVIVLLMVPPRPGWNSAVIDGVILGLSGGALVAIKVTYVVGLLPFALLVFLRDREWTRLGIALLAAAAVLGGLTLWLGWDYWPAYVHDLLTVATVDKRQYPGEDLSVLTASPARLPATALLLLTIVLWRKAGRAAEGLALLVLGPGMIYITYQNWGNDPKWLFFLGLLLLALPPREPEKRLLGLDALAGSRILALLAFFLFAPTLLNMGFSPVRHLIQPADMYSPMFNDLKKADIEVLTEKNYTPTIEYPLPGIDFPEGQEPEEPKPETFEVNGESYPDCGLKQSMIGWTKKALAELGAVEEATGKRVLVADNYDHLWLFGPYQRLRKMSPWYYMTDAGFDGADYVLVPFCAIDIPSRRRKLEVIEEKGWTLDEVIRTDLFILFRRAS